MVKKKLLQLKAKVLEMDADRKIATVKELSRLIHQNWASTALRHAHPLAMPFAVRGLYWYYHQDYKRAANSFSKALSIENKNPYLNFKLGLCFFKQQNWLLAHKYISEAVRLAPEVHQWRIQLRQSEIRLRILSNQQSKNGNVTSSVQGATRSNSLEVEERLITEKLQVDPNNAFLMAQLAQAHYAQKKFWQAESTWGTAISLDANHADWYYQYGNCAEVLLHFENAKKAYQQAISLSSPNEIPAEWYYKLGYVSEFVGLDNCDPNPELAKQAYDKAIKKDSHLKSKNFGIGVFHADKRRWVAAIQAFEQTKAEGIINAELYYRLGFAYDRNYQWQKAESYYQTANSIALKPEWLFRLAFSQEKQLDYKNAAVNYCQAAKLRKNYTPYWYYRSAYCLEKLGDFQEAAETYLKLRKDPNLQLDASIATSDAKTLTKNMLKIKLKNDATQALSWFQLGCIYESDGEWYKAENVYSQAIARSNDLQSLWWYRLGFVLYKQKKFTKACEALRSYRIMQRPHGVSEDILGKDQGFSEAAAYNEYYHILPVVNNTVMYESFSGQGMTCNPYAIFLHLFNNPQYQNWMHIWVINNPSNIPKDFKKFKNIVFISKGSDGYLRYLATAKVLINNSNFPAYFVRKPDQKYLSTWHGTPFKTLGRDMNDRFFEHKNLTRNILQATHVLSPNAHTSKILFEKHDIKNIFTGKLLESGYPRVDLTLNDDQDAIWKIRDRLDVADNERLVFYAPTWRGTHGDVSFDYQRLNEDLNRLSLIKGAKIVFRGHSLMQEALENMNLDVAVVPDEIDTNTLLSATDILITDYSSVLFDFLPKLKPVILYMYDFQEYSDERGLYFTADELPGFKCYNIDELTYVLIGLVKNTQQITYQNNMVDVFAPYDDGQVSKRIVDAVFHDDYSQIKIFNDEVCNKKSLLFYCGPFMRNGITTSAINLLSNIDQDKYTITLVIDPGSIEKEQARLTQFAQLPNINVIARVGRMNLNLEDRYIHSMNNQDFGLDSDCAKAILQQSWDFEYKRIFGYAKFDSLIQFEGYNSFWSGVFTSQKDVLSSIFMHNSMEEEYRLKYPYLKSIFGYCALSDQVISVSKATMELNRDRLSDIFCIAKDKFEYANNLLQPALTIKRSLEPLSNDDQKYFLGKNKVFLTIGRLSVEKDHAKLIRSFAELLKAYPDPILLIIGDGPLRLELEQLITELRLGDSVFLLGVRENPFPLLRQADCFLLSSNHEGQPMTLLEAMILKKMIISTDIVGSRSAIEGRSGYLVDNSVEGLTQGMIDFLEGKFKLVEYDIGAYQDEALEKFYKLQCDWV